MIALLSEAELIPEAGHELPASKPATVDSRVLEFLDNVPEPA